MTMNNGELLWVVAVTIAVLILMFRDARRGR